MFESVRKWSALKVFLIIALLLSTVVVAGFAAYSLQFMSVPLEVKEPFEISDYPTSFSLYPGENVTFEVTVQNLASVTYFAEFDFHLNDTEYQASYATFSNFNYSVAPGTQKLAARLAIASTAPPANLTLTIDLKTATPSPTPSPAPSPIPSPSPSPTPSNSSTPEPSPTPSPTPSNASSPSPSPSPSPTSLTPSLTLLGSGARWAARNGTSALYVNWKDNWAAHHLTDGAGWSWFSEPAMESWSSSITLALQQAGFNVTLAGDIPDNLDDYDLVVLFAYYAIEPRHEPLIREYVSNGGSVVILAGAQCYFTQYSKQLSTYNTAMPIWFGCSSYLNAGGSASSAIDNPFGTSFSNGTVIFTGVPGGFSYAGVYSLNANATAIAFWDSGMEYWDSGIAFRGPRAVFAFTHEYGHGRVYYQAIVEVI